MISEDQIDGVVERMRALGTDYVVLSDILRLTAEVGCLRAPVAAAEHPNDERLRFER